MTLQPTQIHDDGVRCSRQSARKTAYTGQYRKRRKEVWRTVLRGNGRKIKNRRNGAFPAIVRIKHAKQAKNRRKKQHGDYPTIYRMYMQYSACCRGKTAGAYNGVGRTASP